MSNNKNYFSMLSEDIKTLLDFDIVKQNSAFSAKLADLAGKAQNKTFQLVVLGQFKRGKTSLINALLGEALLPVAVVPLTSIITILEYADKEKITVNFLDGKSQIIKKDNLPDFITESKNPNNQKNVSSVKIQMPNKILAEGAQIIDTPGIGSVYKHNTDVAYEFVPKADAGIFVVTADPPIGEVELTFLEKIKNYLAKIIFVQNKIDQIDEKDRMESLDFTKSVIEKSVGKKELNFLPVSAKLAMEGKLKSDQQKITASNIAYLEKYLSDLIFAKKHEILALSIKSKLDSLLSEILLQLEIEEKALLMSANELNQKIALFQKEADNVNIEKEEACHILKGEAEKLSKEILVNDIENLKNSELPKLFIQFEALYKENAHLSNKEMLDKFNQFLEQSIKNIFSAWRKKEEAKIQNDFKSITKRFSDKTNQSIQKILNYCANLFNLKIKELKAEYALAEEVEFKFSFDEYIVEIDYLTPIITALPKVISRPILYQQMKDEIASQFDRHCGRVRYDFSERVAKSVADYSEKLNQTLEETISGINTLLVKNLEDKNRQDVGSQKIRENILKQKEIIKTIQDNIK